MDYGDFLLQRRVLIADVVRATLDELRTGQLPVEEGPLPVSVGLPEWSVKDLLAEMETDRVEFKSSAYYSYKPDIPEKVITESVLKTVAGFFNSGGGTLVVGIADDGEILGIQPDLDQKNMDRDRYVNSLSTATRLAVPASPARSLPLPVRADTAPEAERPAPSSASRTTPAPDSRAAPRRPEPEGVGV